MVVEAHGHSRTDDWAWLRDRHDPAVLAHLRAENAYTEAALAHLAGTRDALYAEMKARIVETDLAVPVRKGPWWYYGRTVEGLEYPIHCRLPVAGGGRDPSAPPLPERVGDAAEDDDPAGRNHAADDRAGAPPWPDEEVVLDENTLAGADGYLDVVNVAVSPDHSLLTYGTDTSGDERFTLRVRALAGGDDLEDRIEGTSYGVAWANDNATVFYTLPDAANRPYQLWRHRLGSDRSGDVLVLEELDERFHLGVGRTKDDAFIVVELHSRVTSEAWLIAADEPLGEPRLVEARVQGIEYSVDHHDGTLLLLTNDDAENFRVMAAAVETEDGSSPRHWQQVVAHRPSVRLEGLEVFAGHLVLYERRDAVPRIRVVPLSSPPRWDTELPEGYLVASPETPSASWGGPNAEFAATSLRYEYSSLVTPRSVFDLDLRDGSAVLRKRQPVLGGYDPDAYATARLWANAPDGTRVPMSIVHSRSVTPDGSAPCLLYGYGSYEYCIDPVFSSLRLSLLERGFVFAIAHVRGGGELGRRWYEEGKLLDKPNTFSDFVACARGLVDAGWTTAERLVARGGSAGGLLMGAVANQAPELFRAIVAEVPFVDCLNTMCDPTLPLTVIEWEEWGNPIEDAEIYGVMARYTPYENIRTAPYPDMLVTAGLEDPRVGYWEPAKWVQRLRAESPRSRVLLKTELDAGHAGPTGRYQAWRDEAFILSFVLDAVGLAPVPTPS